MKLPILALIAFIFTLESSAQTFTLPDGAKLDVIYSYEQYYQFSGALKYPAGTKIYVAVIPKLEPEEVHFTVSADKLGKK